MKYPQAFIFFKDKSVIDPDNLRASIGEDVDVHFPDFDDDKIPAIDNRARVARSVLMHKGIYTRHNSPYVVLNVSEIHAFFVLKYSSDIKGIVWMKSAADFAKLRSSLAVYKNFWLFWRGLYLSTRHYRRTKEVLDEDCPEFTRDDVLFSSLSGHMQSLDHSAIHKAMSNRLNSMALTGEYKI